MTIITIKNSNEEGHTVGQRDKKVAIPALLQ